MGYGREGTLAFVVPREVHAAPVERYELIDASRHVAPLSVYAGWWFCITEGRVERAPTESRYGAVVVNAFTIDQRSGERGQE